MGSRATMNTINDKLELLINNQITKEHFEETIGRMEKRIDKNGKVIKAINTKVNNLETMPTDIYTEIHDQEQRKRNIIIFKLNEHEGIMDKKERRNKEKETIGKLLHDMTDLNLLAEGNINYRIFRVGKDTAKKSRPLKVSFDNSFIRDRVLDCCKNLKEKEEWQGISIVPDLTKIQQDLSKQTRAKLKQKANEKNDNRADDEIDTFEWKVVGHYGLGNLRLARLNYGNDD